MSGPKFKSRRIAGEELLALENASVRLDENVVFRSTNWVWRTGEQWAMLGPDDSGKSLLIQVLLGRVPLAGGEFRSAVFDETSPETIAHVSPITQRRLAVQESSFYQSRWHSGVEEGQRTVAQFLSQESVEERNPFEVDARTGDLRDFLRRRNQFVGWLGIKTLLPRKLVQLSNGEMRKVLLVHALLKGSKLLVLEDPFVGLDAATRDLLHRVINRVMRAGTSVLIATNRAEEIALATTHLLIIDRHQIISQGPKNRMLALWQKRFGSTQAAPPKPYSRDAKIKLEKAVPANGEPLIEFKNVNVRNGRKFILRDITWTLRQGDCWALSGPNGAGKTTLLNLIQGDHPQAYAQDIRLFGQRTDSTKTLWQMRQRLGWMSPELHQHYPGGWDTFAVVCSGFFNTVGLYETPSRAQQKAAFNWLVNLGLSGHAETSFGDLTFGQQRLVLLARAAAKRPRLLILDEPCQALDAVQRSMLLSAVDEAVAQSRASLIFVTHHAGELPRCITHILRLHAGQVREAAPL